MEFLKELEDLGVNVKEGLDRVMGDEDLYKLTLSLFVSTIDENPIQPENFDGSDLEQLIARVHSLKGTTGNLSITPLYTRYMEVLNLLREGKPAEAKTIFVELEPTQTAIVDCIRRYQ